MYLVYTRGAHYFHRYATWYFVAARAAPMLATHNNCQVTAKAIDGMQLPRIANSSSSTRTAYT